MKFKFSFHCHFCLIHCMILVYAHAENIPRAICRNLIPVFNYDFIYDENNKLSNRKIAMNLLCTLINNQHSCNYCLYDLIVIRLSRIELNRLYGYRIKFRHLLMNNLLI